MGQMCKCANFFYDRDCKFVSKSIPDYCMKDKILGLL